MLNTHVTVHKDGETTTFAPGDDVPAWAVKLITNPDVWVDGEPPTEKPARKPAAKSTPPKTDDTDGAGDNDGTDDEDPNDDDSADEPRKLAVPKKGATAKTWAAYAKDNGFEVDETAKASEIREDLAEAGIPVE